MSPSSDESPFFAPFSFFDCFGGISSLPNFAFVGDCASGRGRLGYDQARGRTYQKDPTVDVTFSEILLGRQRTTAGKKSALKGARRGSSPR
mmetsp:Transcript_29480/g.95041  ORF Transcript_29480/g.95041 Transcript_29480/m.95041 type:complete len:91 (+) Transcript_29480:1089-1361(+)